MKTEIFENKGYHKEFYINGKLMGCQTLNTYDGVCGYSSKQNLLANEDIVIDKSYNKKFIINKGQSYTTQIIPLCGKVLGTQREKLNILANSRLNF